MALTDGLNVYYAMEEATGATRLDSVGSLDLTDHNNVAQVTGEHLFGSGYTAASTQYLSHVHNSKFSVDNSQDGFTVGFWFYPTVASVQGVISKGFLNGGSELEWQFIQRNPDGSMVFYMSYDGSSVIAAANTTIPTLNAWNYILGWWNNAEGKIHLRVNCDAGISATFSPNTPFVGTGDFNVGRIFNNFAVYGTYRIDELGIWNRLLTDDEQADLCAGAVYPFTTPVDFSFDASIEFDANFPLTVGETAVTVIGTNPVLRRPYWAREITHDFTMEDSLPQANLKRGRFFAIYGQTGQPPGTVLGRIYFYADGQRIPTWVPIRAYRYVRRQGVLFECGVPNSCQGRQLFAEIWWYTNDVVVTNKIMDLVPLN